MNSYLRKRETVSQFLYNVMAVNLPAQFILNKGELEMNIITKTLDTLALKLTDYKHKWTNQERKLYESAIKKAGQIEPQVSGQNGISQSFVCKCEKQSGWITDGMKTKPCPKCGREYIGKYNQDNLCIDAVCIFPGE